MKIRKKIEILLQRILQEIMKKNSTWNIRRMVDESFVPANQRIILKIDGFLFTLVVFYVNSSCHQQQLLHLMRRGNHRFLLCEVTHRFLNLSCSSNMAGICILHFKHANCHARHFYFPCFYWIFFLGKCVLPQ